MFEYVVSIISFLGLYIGNILAFVTKGELKKGARYFVLLEKIIFGLIMLGLLYYSPVNSLLVVGLIIGFLSGYMLRNAYIFLGCALAASFVNLELAALFGSLIFIFGLVHSSLLKRVILFNAVLFFVPFFIFFPSENIGFLTGFVVGGLVNFLK